MGNIQKLPMIGKITLPVHLMVYQEGNDGERKHYSCGFAHFRYQDCLSTVYDDNTNMDDSDHEIGSIGATMGGHHFMSRFKPNYKAFKDGKGEWIDVIIDNRDIWYAIDKAMNTPEARAAIENAVANHEKWQNERIEAANKKQEERKVAARRKEMEKLDDEEAALLEEAKELDAELEGDSD